MKEEQKKKKARGWTSMAEEQTSTAAETQETSLFRRHKYLTYQGYAFPWYATLIWIAFFVGGLIYLVKHILLN